MELNVGSTLRIPTYPSFRIQKKIGAGQEGNVFRAREIEGERKRIAVKVPHKHRPASEQRKTIRRRALEIVHQSNLPTSVASSPLLPYELPGEITIHDHITGKANPTLGPEKSLKARLDLCDEIEKQLGETLEAAGEKGLIHRDVKWENVIKTPRGNWVLVDWSLATNTDGDNPFGEFAVGTARYMAPEILLKSQGTASTDWYAMGVLMLETLKVLGEFGLSFSNVRILNRRKAFKTVHRHNTQLEKAKFIAPAIYATEITDEDEARLIKRLCIAHALTHPFPEARPTSRAEIAAI